VASPRSTSPSALPGREAQPGGALNGDAEPRPKRLLLVGDERKGGSKALIQHHATWLTGRGCECEIVMDRESSLEDREADCVVVWGGDGSLLGDRAAHGAAPAADARHQPRPARLPDLVRVRAHAAGARHAAGRRTARGAAADVLVLAAGPRRQPQRTGARPQRRRGQPRRGRRHDPAARVPRQQRTGDLPRRRPDHGDGARFDRLLDGGRWPGAGARTSTRWC
jgi:hypothetical protein